jgi:hypothetical protein
MKGNLLKEEVVVNIFQPLTLEARRLHIEASFLHVQRGSDRDRTPIRARLCGVFSEPRDE